MKRHIIIHAGLHKTESSSIQACFSQLDMPAHDYLNWGNTNHSAFYQQAFSPQKMYPRSHPLRKLLPGEYERHRQGFRQKLKESIEAATKQNLIISAESLSGNSFKNSLAEFHDLILPYASKMTVIAYVRPLESLLASAMQQQIKFGQTLKFPPGTALPKRISRPIEVFGQENVILKKYYRPDLLKGDIAFDFASLIGVEISPEDIKHENTSISLEAVAVMYLHNLCFCDDIKHRNNTTIQMNVAGILKEFGVEKFRLAPEIIAPIKRKTAKAMAEIEKMAGVSLQGEPITGGGISSLKDLERIALKQTSPLESYIDKLYLTSKADRAILDAGIAVAKSQTDPARYLAYLVEAIKMVEMMRIIGSPELAALCMQKSKHHIWQKSPVSYGRSLMPMAWMANKLFGRNRVVVK